MSEETTTPEKETPSTDAADELENSPDESAVATEDEPAGAEGEEEKEAEKVDQSVDITDVGPCKKHIVVKIEHTTIESRMNEKYSELSKDVVVPGFRKGRAPRRVIEKQFRKDIGNQIKGELLMASLEQLAEDYDIAPITPPNLDPSKIEIPQSGAMTYEFDVEVRPQFTLPDFKGMQIKRPVRDFTDEDVNREQRRLLSQYGQLVPKEEPAELEDYVIVDMTTRHGEQVIGTVNEITLRVDKQLAFKDGIAEKFGEQVVGAKGGDRREVEIKMSDNVSNPALAGNTVQAYLEVKDVKKLRLPELTHEFLDKFGVHSEDELREEIMAALKRRLEYQQRQSARQQILQKIEEESKLELPQDLLLRQARRAVSRKAMEMQEAGMSEDEIKAEIRVMQQDIVRSTALSLKEHFVLQKVAEDEDIDVDEEEINQEIEAMAEENDESPRRVRARLEKEDQLETLAAMLVERKALDHILTNVEYEDVPMDQPDGESVAVTEEQAVEGEMRDVGAEAEEAAKAEEEAAKAEEEK